MAKKTAKKATSGRQAALALRPAGQARALRKTSLAPIITAIAKTETQIRNFRGVPGDERAKEVTLQFLDRMRAQLAKKCRSSDDDDFKNIPFSLAKRSK